VDWSVYTDRYQLSAELRLRMEAARARYDYLKDAVVDAGEEIRAALGSDGYLAIQKSRGKAREALEALLEYKIALKEFTDFVNHGKRPRS